MSCLLLKTSSDNLQTESIHEALGETGPRQCFEGCPCQSSFDRLSGLSCGLSGHVRKACLGSKNPLLSIQNGKEEEPRKVLHALNDCQNECRELDSGNATDKSACFREHKIEWEDYFVDDVVSKLVAHLHLLPESPVLTSLKSDLPKSDYQEGDSKDAESSASTLDVEISSSTVSCTKDCNAFLPIGVPEGEVSVGNHHCASFKLRSALRGGYEKSGLGSRPKKNVSWSPDVYDPPCTSTSHIGVQNRRRHHHHPKVYKNRHKGKGHTRSDSQKKLPKRFRSGSTIFPERGQQSRLLSMKDDMTTSLDDLRLKSSRARSFISPQGPCFPGHVLSLGESQIIALDTMHRCYPKHVMACDLFV